MPALINCSPHALYYGYRFLSDYQNCNGEQVFFLLGEDMAVVPVCFVMQKKLSETTFTKL